MLSGTSSSPAVILVRTNPGRITITCTPLPCRRSPSPWAKASSPAFEEPYTKFDFRARSPATEESTTITPCPCRRMRSASGMHTDTAPT